MPHALSRIFEPRSVAIVGASSNPRKRGYQAVRALLDAGYSGEIYPVNPAAGELLGLEVARSVAEVDGTPDLAYICTPAESVPDVLEACAAKGIPGAVVLAVGFRESGGAGAALETRVVDIARRTGIRVVGPNTSGVLNTLLGLNLVGVRGVPKGRLAIISQSGNGPAAPRDHRGPWGRGATAPAHPEGRDTSRPAWRCRRRRRLRANCGWVACSCERRSSEA